MPFIRKPFVNVPWVHCHPYAWDDTKNRPNEITNRWVRAHWLFNCCLYISYIIFLLCRTAHICLDPAETVSNKFYISFATQFYSPASLLYITTVTTRNNFVPFVRRYISFLENGEAFRNLIQNWFGNFAVIISCFFS